MKTTPLVIGSTFYIGLLIFVDQWIKNNVVFGRFNYSGERFSVEYTKNFNMAFGAGFETTGILNVIIGLCFALALILIFWLMFYFLKDKKLPLLKLSMAHLLAGMGGNAWDKIGRGFSVDYLHIKMTEETTIAINLADVILLLGMMGILTEILGKSSQIWFEANRRKNLIIEPEFQKGEAKILVSIIWATSFVLYMGFAGMIVYLKSPRRDEILWGGLLLHLFITLCLSATSYIFGLMHSHRTSGPLFSFKRYLQDYRADHPETKNWNPRESDFHKEVLRECLKEFHEEGTGQKKSGG
jgi:lipoprotein signal peptidase